MPEGPVWKQIPEGGIEILPGSTDRIRTGAWRTERPVIDFSKCTHCMICWVDCPDACFEVSEEQLTGVDLHHCKGCGICASVCPAKCIEMIPETSFAEAAQK